MFFNVDESIIFGGLSPRSVEAYRNVLVRFDDMFGLGSVGDVFVCIDFVKSCGGGTSFARIFGAAAKRFCLAVGVPNGCADPMFLRFCGSLSDGVVVRRAEPVLLGGLETVLTDYGGRFDAADRGLLLVGFFGAFRVAELVGLRWCDVDFCDDGTVWVELVESKTGVRNVAFFHRAGGVCAHCWLFANRGVGESFLFPNSSSRSGHVSTRKVSRVVKRVAYFLGLDEDTFSSHSLRAGFITSAAMAGVSPVKICLQSGHSSVGSLSGYIRVSDARDYPVI